jgi:hypothetical protein
MLDPVKSLWAVAITSNWDDVSVTFATMESVPLLPSRCTSRWEIFGRPLPSFLMHRHLRFKLAHLGQSIGKKPILMVVVQSHSIEIGTAIGTAIANMDDGVHQRVRTELHERPEQHIPETLGKLSFHSPNAKDPVVISISLRHSAAISSNPWASACDKTIPQPAHAALLDSPLSGVRTMRVSNTLSTARPLMDSSPGTTNTDRSPSDRRVRSSPGFGKEVSSSRSR